MWLSLIGILASIALAGCAGEGFSESAWEGASTERPAWRRESPVVPEPAVRMLAPYRMDRA